MFYKIAFCIPTLGTPRIETWNSFNQLIKPRSNGDLQGESHFINVKDRPVDDARLHLTRQALAIEGLTHILWIDDDMEFPPDALQKLLAHDKDIVGGLCHNRRAPAYQPIVARQYDPVLKMPQDAYGFVYNLPDSGLVSCDATGGAFLLVKAQVFKDIEARFGRDSWWEPEGEASEDFSFCRRAKACDYEIFVDCGLDIGHMAQVMVRKREAKALRTAEVAGWIDLGTAPRGKAVATVVIPTYNQKPAYLKAAVLSALNQTVPTEVIVVDDGTTDYDLRVQEVMSSVGGGVAIGESADLVAGTQRSVVWLSKRARLLKHDTNRGIAAALNTGIAEMTTDYFCWLSSDDLFTPDKVEKQLKTMEAARAKASFHDYTVIDSTPESFGRYVIGPTWNSIDEQKRQLLETCCINGSTVMLHASVFEAYAEDSKMGRFFDPDLKFAQDWDAWCKVAQKFFWLKVPEPLGVRREGENLTSQIQQSAASDERRKRRDEEDKIVKERYMPKAAELFVVVGAANAFYGVFKSRSAAQSFCGSDTSLCILSRRLGDEV